MFTGNRASAAKTFLTCCLIAVLFAGQLTLFPAVSSAAGNLAAGKAITASSVGDVYVASNANDSSQATYWESSGNAFPQWIRVDLGASSSVNQVVLKLPASWEARTQTLSVQGSTNDASYSNLAASAGYTFSPSGSNTVTINFTAATARYIRVNFTANTGWPAAQLSELEVYGSTTAPGGIYEAESAALSGGAKTNTDHSGYTGSAFVDGYLAQGAATTFTVTAASAGSYDAALRYANASGSTKTLSVYVNGTKIKQTSFANLANWDNWSTKTETLSLLSGSNTIAYKYDATDSGNVNLDNLTLTPGAAPTATPTAAPTSTPAPTATPTAAPTATPAPSASPTATPSTGPGSNLAIGKSINASSSIYTFVPANANDGDVTTYWEGAGGSYPNTLSVNLGANASVTSVVVKLNPASAWATRTQTIEVLGHNQATSAFTSLVPAASYTFNPASGNSVTIPVTATVSELQLKITANSGSSAGQVAEFQIIGTPAANPDLTITAMSWSPAAPVETDAITLTAAVKNAGTSASAATNVGFYLGTTLAGTAPVGALAAGAASNVSLNIGARDAGAYALSAKVDESNLVIELNEGNNSYTNPSSLTVNPVSSSDLIASPVSWTPGNPAGGNTVTFSIAIKNQGTAASAGGAHNLTLTVIDAATNAVVKTLTGVYSGVIASGATTAPVTLGTWNAVNGKYTVKSEIAADANELEVKRANNIQTQPLHIGRGANMPYDMYEAEDGVVGGGAVKLAPNRNIGDLAGEASGRRAVTLNSTGSYVEFTTKASTNTLVTRFSIPDSASGGGTNATLNVYVNGVFTKAISLTSKYAWLYGSETSPGNSPSAGSPRHIYDEANMMFDSTIPAGSTIRLQKDAANTSQYAIDFISLEQVSPIANPDPAKYTVPSGFTHQDVQNALDKVRMDTTGSLVGVYLPAGTYQTASKFQVYGKPVKVIGAGPWYTRFVAPESQDNTDIGFRAEASANGSTFANFAYFGNYTSRIDGPGKVFDFSNVANITIDNIWTEHQVCMYWGANTDYMVIKNSRIRNTFADGINMTNGSTNNLVSNNEARATGDDSFALFSAIDSGGSDMKDNVYENLTSILTWRAAGVAVYGGYANTFRNIYIADTLCYSGITISSLDFGYPMNGFGASPTTNLQNISIVRAGGHFWGSQTFPAIWVFSASKVFQGIRVSDVDIVDPTYHGIMFQTNYVGSSPQFPVADTIFTNITISGAQKSGDAFDAKSGVGIWANESAEAGQGPAVGSVVFNNLKITDTVTPIKNTTSTFTITVNP
ncbi:discoidin domain-containing protein [Paenibacillus sp. S150]|uniref:galactose-binding domain-containing protein n=1 Tax=Paenibacillus sp. S150 TaxID=2749826 RepID=UPI001C56E319|nr:discoidin domain-containing protein [Paenibacillus sp. S150]MBW4083079.1 discoidin domain-containing protein [Paenibacillus sp. S150]